MWPPSGKIWLLQFADQTTGREAEMPNLLGHAERRIGQRDARLQARYARHACHSR